MHPLNLQFFRFDNVIHHSRSRRLYGTRFTQGKKNPRFFAQFPAWSAFAFPIRAQTPLCGRDIALRAKQKAATRRSVTADYTNLWPSLTSRYRAVISGASLRDAVDLPDLSGEGDEVRGVPDELERGRPIQTVRDDGEGAVHIDLDERACVRQRTTRVARACHSVR